MLIQGDLVGASSNVNVLQRRASQLAGRGGFVLSDLVFGFSMAAVSDWATGTQFDNNSSRPCFILTR
jgi:hypothetical protein